MEIQKPKPKPKPKPMAGVKCCDQQLWFAALVSFVLCFVLLCFDYSALTSTSPNSNGRSTVLVNNYANDITTTSSDSISPLLHYPLVTVVNQTEIDSCLGRYIYIHQIPASFNDDLLKIVICLHQDRMRRQKREYLFSFAGAPRPDLIGSIRGKIIDHCLASGGLCKLIGCSYGAANCDNPANVMKVFQNSVFCLQPSGDSYTRRSIFDAILAGCIPVFFHPGTVYAQYLWHLPKNYSSYSLYIPVRDVKDWKVDVNATLIGISEERISGLREKVIRLIPNVIYADPRTKLQTMEDAFDLAVKGILERIDRVRRLTKQGMDPGAGFADPDDYKYTFAPYGQES